MLHFAKGGPGAGQHVRVPFDELWDGLAGWAVRELKPALSPKGVPDPRESQAVQQRRAATNCGAIIVVPLHYRGKTLGTLTAINRLDEPDFTQRDVELMVAMANQAAVAIENARLRQETEESLRELERLYRTLSREGWQTIQRGVSATGYRFDQANIVPAEDFWMPAIGLAMERRAFVPSATDQPVAVAPLVVHGEVIGA